MKRMYWFVVITLVYLYGCTEVVEREIVEIDQEIYISSFISPENDTIRVNVSRTLSTLNLSLSLNNPEENINRFLIKDATVSISDTAGNTIQLPYSEEERSYVESSMNFNIAAGETYFLQVDVVNKQYTASCQIPNDNIDDIDTEINQTEDGFSFPSYNLNLSFDDIDGIDNFYIIGAFLEASLERNLQNKLFFGMDAFQTDNLRNGGIISVNETFSPISDFANEVPEVAPQDLVLQVINAEEPLFQLLRGNFLNEDSNGNPFVELSVEPNTIRGDGATGIFAGYRYFEKRIPFEQ